MLTVPLGKTLMNKESSCASFRTEAPPSPTTTNLFLLAAQQNIKGGRAGEGIDVESRQGHMGGGNIISSKSPADINQARNINTLQKVKRRILLGGGRRFSMAEAAHKNQPFNWSCGYSFYTILHPSNGGGGVFCLPSITIFRVVSAQVVGDDE